MIHNLTIAPSDLHRRRTSDSAVGAELRLWGKRLSPNTRSRWEQLVQQDQSRKNPYPFWKTISNKHSIEKWDLRMIGRTHTTNWSGGASLGFSGSINDINISSFQVGLFVCFKILLWHSCPPTLTTTYGSLKPDLSAEGSSRAAYKNVLRMNSCNFGIETADRCGTPPDFSPAIHFSINIPHNVPFL